MTTPDTLVDIDPGDPGGARRVTAEEARRIITECIGAGKFMRAAAVATQLADRLPHEIWPQWQAAEALMLHQEAEPAFEYIERALAIDARNIACLVLKARLCIFSGAPERAIRLIDEAIDLAPFDARLRCIRGELLMDAGDIERARAGFLSAIEFDPDNASALLGLSRLPGDHYDASLIERVETGLRSGLWPPDEAVKIHFALANAWDAKDDAGNHFRHLAAGNGLVSRSLRYDPAASAREAQGIIDFFSADFFARHDRVRGHPAHIVFIVGFPRCGSTLIEQILSSHPSVSAAGETNALRHALRDYQQANVESRGYPYWLDALPDDAPAGIAANYLGGLRPFGHDCWLTDKLLDNYTFVGVIRLIFPNATIVNVRRDPVDVCYSCYKRLFSPGALPYTYDLEHLAARYRDYRRVIDHWDTVLPGLLHHVDYEGLVSNPAAVTRELLARCGLPWHDACLDFRNNARVVQTSSNAQVRQPLYADSIGRWKPYAAHLGPLLALGGD